MRAVVVALSLLAAVSPPVAAQTVVLDENSYWRRCLCFDRSRYSPALIKSDGQKALGAGFSRLQRDVEKEMQTDGLNPAQADWMEHAYLGNRGARAFVPWTTPPPPAEWANADFDDVDWPRLRRPFQGGRPGKVTFLALGQYDSSVDLRLRASFYRGRFVLDDPAKAGTLTLSLSFVGGARAFVNGREIGRGHLPAGDLAFDARGEDYPLRAYQPGGEAAQVRKLSARVPAGALRAGVNVVAIELRASDMHPIVATMPTQPNWGTARPWPHGRLIEMKLRADSGKLASGSRRPAGVQVWAEDVHRRVQSDDFLPPGESPGVVRVAGAKNGVFAGQVVVGADRALSGLRVTVSDLAHAGGGKPLPASCVEVSWPAPYPAAEFDLDHTHDERGLDAKFPSNSKLASMETFGAGKLCLFDHLTSKAPATLPANTSQPAWLSFRVPADAAAGTYRGTVTVAAQGVTPVELPVDLDVADWALPDPKGFKTLVGCEENPYGVAKQYGLKLWSEEHWRLVETSLAQLGRVGNSWVNVPIIVNSEFGNGDDSMVKWTKKGNGFTFDFALLDRYLGLVEKHCGRPRVVHFIVMHGMGRRSGGPSQVKAGGALMAMEPVSGLPAEAKQAWLTFAKEAFDHMKSRGLEKSMYWGAPLEGESDGDLKTLLAQAAPQVGWTAGPHEMMANGTYAKQSQFYKLVADIRYHGGWGGFRDDMGWKSPTLHLLNPRAGGTALAVHTTSLPFVYRMLPERALSWGRGGFTRVGADEWAGVHYDKMEPPKWLTGIPVLWVLWPGKDGAEPSIRFEMLLEGVQETEARIAIEQALDRGAVSGAAAARAKKILARRVDETRFILGNSLIPAFEDNDFGWQVRSRELYRAAAEAAK